MRAILCEAYGPPESLKLGELPPPKLGPRDVRIAVHAAGVNFPDTLMIQGKYQFKPPLPFAPGLECAGTVLEVGPKAGALKPGQRVMAVTGWGAMAEEVCAPEQSVFPIPDAMSFAQAAGFPVTYGTVYHALVDRAALQPGETLLVHGAAGGVGLNAVEIGKLLGAHVIATAGSDDKLRLAQDYGAEQSVNYARENIRERVKALTGDRGADVIFDPVGGDAFDQSMRCIAWNGRLLVIGFASGRIPEVPANLVLLKGCAVIGVFWGAFANRDPARSRANVEAMLRWFAQGQLKPHVSLTFPLARAAEALQAILSRQATGKVIVQVR